jgi:hypothetical protein
MDNDPLPSADARQYLCHPAVAVTDHDGGCLGAPVLVGKNGPLLTFSKEGACFAGS